MMEGTMRRPPAPPSAVHRVAPRAWRRSTAGLAVVLVGVAMFGALACGDDDAASETLPPIRTTTTTSTTTTTVSLTPVEYVIQSGETLGVIAERAGVTFVALCAFNELESCDYVQAGQTILIPPAGYVPPTTLAVTSAPPSS
jgi:LysM repeat protein